MIGAGIRASVIKGSTKPVRGWMNSQAKRVEVVVLESLFEDFADIDKALCPRQLSLGTSDSQIIADDLPLLHCPECKPAQFQKLGIPKVLHAKPEASSKYEKDNSHGFLARKQEKQAQQATKCGYTVQHDDGMPVGKPPLHQLVMDVLSIGGKERLAVQEAAGDGDYSIQDRQSEGYDGNTDRNQGRGLAPTHQSQSTQG